MAANAVGLHHAPRSFLCANCLGDTPERERADMIETVDGLDNILGDEFVRCVTVVAGGRGVMPGMKPILVDGIHPDLWLDKRGVWLPAQAQRI